MLAAIGAPVDHRVPVSVLQRIPGELRKQRGALTITTFNGRIVNVEAGDTSEHVYGMAFDIGTTNIVGTLLHLETGKELAAVGSVNPQTVYGGDLMSRIAYAQFDEKKLVALRAKVLNAINGFIREACANAGVSREHVYKIVVVGHTCMHHIFLGVDVTFVGLAPYAPAVSDGIVVPAGELPQKAAPNAQMALLSERERTRAEELTRRIEHVALAARPDFQDIFIDGMSFDSAESIAPRLTAAEMEPRRTAAG